MEHQSTKVQFEAEHGGTATFVESHAVIESEQVAAAKHHEIHRHDIEQEELLADNTD